MLSVLLVSGVLMCVDDYLEQIWLYLNSCHKFFHQDHLIRFQMKERNTYASTTAVRQERGLQKLTNTQEEGGRFQLETLIGNTVTLLDLN